jgi:hypothetical protein
MVAGVDREKMGAKEEEGRESREIGRRKKADREDRLDIGRRANGESGGR